MSLRLVFIAAFTIASTWSLQAQAEAPLLATLGGFQGFGNACLGPNDDGTSNPIDLTPAFPNGLDFFGTRHTVAYVNTNGNITFGGPLPTYTPEAFPVADQPMIAPYWADVDIRGGACTQPDGGDGYAGPCETPNSNGVWWYLEPGRMVVTWDAVGYFDCHHERIMSFQLILTATDACGSDADFDVAFRYARCEWTTGDASNGMGGLGGLTAQAGFDAGNERDFVMIPGSRRPEIKDILCKQSNVDDPGIWRFAIRGGAVLCPEAGEPCDTGKPGVCGVGRTQCVAEGVSCQQEGIAGEETCDERDNDCDGQTDEGDDLCSAGQTCFQGRCQARCFEFGCPDGQRCSVAGVCEDVACASVTCQEGQWCEAGRCKGECTDIVCPQGQQCRQGRCVPECEGVTCDATMVCESGICVAKCPCRPCGPGQTCTPEGTCVESACIDKVCTAGQVCLAGACVDACENVRCPSGESCELGMCEPTQDAGPSGALPDAGTLTGGETESANCGCRLAGRTSRPQPLGWVLLLTSASLILLRQRGR